MSDTLCLGLYNLSIQRLDAFPSPVRKFLIMRAKPRASLNPLALALSVAFLVASAHAASGQNSPLFKRDGHGHHHGAPLLELNETEVTMWHAPTPESYYTIDWEGGGGEGSHYPGLMVMHGILMCLAFFAALPMAIVLRSVKHATRGLATMAFWVLVVLGCATIGLYTKLTPNMYEGSVHGRHGYLVLLLALSLSTLDILALVRRITFFVRSDEKFSFKGFWTRAILARDSTQRAGPEYVGLVVDEPEEFEESKVQLPNIHPNESPRDQYHGETAQWANEVHRHQFQRHQRTQSTVSEGTLYGHSSPARSLDKLHHVKPRTMKSYLRQAGQISFAILERFLVVGGLMQLLTGIVIYTGGCRENYVNGCLAHLIKGAIFWSYGLLTFARFLGSFAEYGWAWNQSPGDHVSAEFVESFVIFLYGATNTWMERFGANPGDPFTTKQIQHISIAVMFCFAGLIGMGIESKRVRRWLAASVFSSTSTSQDQREPIVEPPSYSASFNPFPALVIGVTGAAMAAHSQTYFFQVQIHELWGNLLVAFAVLRCFSYFFLWLGPPRSPLPSRPPTEALGSFFLACGGLVFMFSTEEVTIAAMRRGRDDIMMFLNVAVAMTCFAFCWTLLVVGFKGWLKSRSRPQHFSAFASSP